MGHGRSRQVIATPNRPATDARPDVVCGPLTIGDMESFARPTPLPASDAFPEGWRLFDDTSPAADVSRSDVTAEYYREVAPGHPLYGTQIEVVADASGNDDILVRHCDDTERFTVVHLVWSGKPEAFGCPTIEYDGTFEGFVRWEYALYGVLPKGKSAVDIGVDELVDRTRRRASPTRPPPARLDRGERPDSGVVAPHLFDKRQCKRLKVDDRGHLVRIRRDAMLWRAAAHSAWEGKHLGIEIFGQLRFEK